MSLIIPGLPGYADPGYDGCGTDDPGYWDCGMEDPGFPGKPMN